MTPHTYRPDLTDPTRKRCYFDEFGVSNCIPANVYRNRTGGLSIGRRGIMSPIITISPYAIIRKYECHETGRCLYMVAWREVSCIHSDQSGDLHFAYLSPETMTDPDKLYRLMCGCSGLDAYENELSHYNSHLIDLNAHSLQPVYVDDAWIDEAETYPEREVLLHA